MLFVFNKLIVKLTASTRLHIDGYVQHLSLHIPQTALQNILWIPLSTQHCKPLKNNGHDLTVPPWLWHQQTGHLGTHPHSPHVLPEINSYHNCQQQLLSAPAVFVSTWSCFTFTGKSKSTKRVTGESNMKLIISHRKLSMSQHA